MMNTVSALVSILTLAWFAATAMAGDIRIVGFNVWHGIDGRGTVKMGEYETSKAREARFGLLVAGLKALDPDIIGIQEANMIPSYPRRLASSIGRDAVWRMGNSGIRLFGAGLPVNYAEGLAVLAKRGYKIEYLGSRRLSGGGIQRDHFSCHLENVRYAMAARVRVDERPLIVFNVHTTFCYVPDGGTEKKLDELVSKGLASREERAGIVEDMEKGRARTERDIIGLLEFVKETTARHDHPYVIMGDFNTTLASVSLNRLVRELALLDPYALKNPGRPGYTWDPSLNPNTKYDGSPQLADGKTPRRGLSALEAEFDRTTPRRIDFIFLSKHFSPGSIKGAGLVFNGPTNGRFASDHFGVEVVVDGVPR